MFLVFLIHVCVFLVIIIGLILIVDAPAVSEMFTMIQKLLSEILHNDSEVVMRNSSCKYFSPT